MAGPWGCAGPGRVAQDKVGTLDGGPRTPSWQSPRVCRATFSNRLELGRSKEKPRVRGGARLALPWQIFQFEEPIRIPESIFQ